MFRFLKVRGKPGCIVPNPHGDARRYIGKVAKPVVIDAKPDPSLSMVDMFDDSEEVIRDEPSIRKAIPKHLDLLAIGVGKDAESVVWASAPEAPAEVAGPPVVSEKPATKPKGN